MTDKRQLPQRLFPLALLVIAAVAALFFGSVTRAQQQGASGWATYGGDPGGTRYSPAAQISAANVQKLKPVWMFHTHALETSRPGSSDASFEATPILFGRALYFTSPFDQVFAVDASTGDQLWTFDPHIEASIAGMLVTSRGVAAWSASADLNQPCASRIFVGTLDGRLVALDAKNGSLCTDFGKDGQVDLRNGVEFQNIGGYGVTSPPTVVGNIVVVGSSIADNQQVEMESGLVRAFDVHTGRLLWSWDPIPWAAFTHPHAGAGNVWSVISADPQLGLIFLPTSSASPDYYGGLRPGDNRDADSVVALDAKTGRRVWGFQTVHHNLWDYDVPSEPVLFTYRGNIPAVAVTTKQGQVFILDRRTGLPLAPVSEQPVKPSPIPSETSWATQPVSSLPPLSPLIFPGVDDNGPMRRDPPNAAFCNAQIAKLRYDGFYTPPGTTASLLFPSNLGGVNWGGAAWDPRSGLLYANVNRQVFSIRLIPRRSWFIWWHENEADVRDWPVWIYIGLGILLLDILGRLEHQLRKKQPALRYPWLPSWPWLLVAMAVMSVAAFMCMFPRTPDEPHFGHELSPQRGTPYYIARDPVVDHNGHPCVAPPWGETVALDLNRGTIVWTKPLGTLIDGQQTGSPTFGGPIVTAGGLVFSAGTDDARLRALDAASGQELWSGVLPASARSTPMTYTLDGRQFVVVAAGGHAGVAGTKGDALVAFSLTP